MSSQTRDLWPEDISAVTAVSPVAILREQAAALTEKTKGLLQGEVITRKSPSGRALEHRLYLVAPALDNYRYALLGAVYPERQLAMYPVSLDYCSTGDTFLAATEDEFVHTLTDLLSRDETKQIVQSLLAQIE